MALPLNFGTGEIGFGEVQPESSTEATTTLDNVNDRQMEAAPLPDANVNEMLTTDDPEAPAMPAKPTKDNTANSTPTPTTNRPQEKPEKGNDPKTNISTPTTKPTPKPDPNALYTGKNNPSKGQGSGGPQGDQGDKMGGADISNQPGKGGTSGTGTGNQAGDGLIDFNLGNRKIVTRPPISDNSQKVGKVVVQIKVDRNGEVFYAKFTSSGSTTTDGYLRGLAERPPKKPSSTPKKTPPKCKRER